MGVGSEGVRDGVHLILFTHAFAGAGISVRAFVILGCLILMIEAHAHTDTDTDTDTDITDTDTDTDANTHTATQRHRPTRRQIYA